MNYSAENNRYDKMIYRRCGRSGIMLPAISLGLWQNFGSSDVFEKGREIIRHAFNSGITHFDLANNYGPAPGSAEENFGRILASDFRSYRDQIIISSKAGYLMWPGPYGQMGSRKHLLASLDQSLKRMQLDYVDIFYSHRPDPDTPLEETMGALSHAVKQGKALYAGISSYPARMSVEAEGSLRDSGSCLFVNQSRYNMLDCRVEEDGLLDVLEEIGAGFIAFSPLAQGLLTNKYLKGVPSGSRMAKVHGSLRRESLTPDLGKKLNELNLLAGERGQSLAQMAIAWLLKDSRLTSVLIGASSVEQLNDNLDSIDNLDFSDDELRRIEKVCGITRMH